MGQGSPGATVCLKRCGTVGYVQKGKRMEEKGMCACVGMCGVCVYVCTCVSVCESVWGVWGHV